MQPQGTYSDTAGLRLLTALPESGVFRTPDAVEAGSRLGLTDTHVHHLLHELARSGWVSAFSAGSTRRWIARPRRRGAPVHRRDLSQAPAAVSHWSALAHWELTEQVPQVVTVSSPTRSAARGAAGKRARMRPGTSGSWPVSATVSSS